MALNFHLKTHSLLSNKTIFVAPLDWGLGHATRCVPIIRGLLQNSNKIILGITPLTRIIFDQEFPELEKLDLPAYNIRYSSFFSLGIKLLLDAPRILRVIKEEKKVLDGLISKHGIEIVISDNRFGLYGNKTQNVFVTHQLFLKSPFAVFLAQRINKNFILKFDEVWVPDYETIENSLSGDLSHGEQFHKNIKYIGPQSRLINYDHAQKKYDYLFLLSGPEPHHPILKKLLVDKVKLYPQYKFALVTNADEINYLSNLESFILPDSVALSKLIAESKTVVCRSGYSTLMDLHLLNVSGMILIPTPGQTEQEYLASYWVESKKAECVLQKDLKNLSL